MAAENWIFDNDGGLDDAYALVLALSQPTRIHLPCITVVSGNVPVNVAAKAVSKTLAVCQVKVPIYIGASEGLIEKPHPIPYIHGADGLGNSSEYSKIEGYTDCIRTDIPAARAIVRVVNENKGNISIIATGPLTNIALALKLDPEIPKKTKRFVCMGGAHYAKGNTSFTAEFNFYCDPEAAEICLRAFPTAEILTAENGDEFPITPVEQRLWHNPATPKGRFLMTISEQKMKVYGRIHIFDALAFAIAIDAERVIQKAIKAKCKVELHGTETRGMMLIDWGNAKNYPCPDVAPTVVLRTKPKEVLELLVASTAL